MQEVLTNEIVAPGVIRAILVKLIAESLPSDLVGVKKIPSAQVRELAKIQTTGGIERVRRDIVRWAVVQQDSDEYSLVTDDIIVRAQQLLSSNSDFAFNSEALVLQEARSKYEGKLWRTRLFATDTNDCALLVLNVSALEGKQELCLRTAIVPDVPGEAFSQLPLLATTDLVNKHKLVINTIGGRVPYARFLAHEYT